MYDIYPTSHQVRFDTESLILFHFILFLFLLFIYFYFLFIYFFFLRGSTNQDPCVIVTNNVWSRQQFPFWRRLRRLAMNSAIQSKNYLGRRSDYPFFIRPSISILFLLFYIDLRPRQTRHSKDGGCAYSIGVGELGWQYGTGLKSHGTVTNWCTGREWPVNCMKNISIQWRSNMPFQRRRKCIFRWPVMGKYWVGDYITRWRQEVSVWRPGLLVIRCGRESHYPAEGALRPPIEQFGDQIS